MGFRGLTPDLIINEIEVLGFQLTGRFHQLNSYENRVFEFDLENEFENLKKIVVKFYRPDRWTKNQISEEHNFLFELDEEGVSVVTPIKFEGQSVLETKNSDFSYAIFEKFQGRMPQEFIGNDLEILGENLARFHNVGSRKKFEYRLTLSVDEFGYKNLFNLENYIFPELKTRYFDAAELILEKLEKRIESFKKIRIHGDFHKGNILEKNQHFYIVDFDDCINGIEVQDFWMLLDKDDFDIQLDILLKGYTKLRSFDEDQLSLINNLRALRLIYYSGWISNRWSDESFKKLFPFFLDFNYWAREVELIESLAYDDV